ncbi:hypothetical protein SRB5_36370 [Streptomyces sp. RB5]|uniref:DUF7507 domain-containing protein n=1 Tax=Streptomyces smaragdinus TaxID=2585196 RepID=A0A7K0CJ27_9ACTN|nr:DUF11 domain-containing protein [Streptomyces smaragdinus]MQY13489.1 hypothetical protein [Streptomyces smaragdinus]
MLLAVVAAVLVGTAGPSEAQGEWDCLDGPGPRLGYLFEAGATGATAFRIVQVDSSGAASDVGVLPMPVEAVGYNTYDGYFYGVASGNQIMRIDSSGDTALIGSVVGTAFTSGDFDNAGHLWLLDSSVPGNWVEVDLLPGSPTYGQTVRTGTINYPGNQYRALGDWTYMTGPSGPGLYGIVDMVGQRLPNLMFFNTTTHTFSSLGEVPGLPVGIGGVDTRGSYTDGTYLYVYTYTSGQVFRVDITARTSTVLPQIPGATTFGDGSQCTAAPAGTVNVVKQIDGRNATLDQFRVGLDDNRGNELGSVTTTGAEATAETGPLEVMGGQTYHLRDSGADGDLPPPPDLYGTAASCTNNVTGAEMPLTGGSGNWSFRLPRTAGDWTCTLTNTARGTGSIQLAKEPDPLVATQLGQTVQYTMVVRNTGDTSIQTLTLTDSQGGGPHPCDLPPGGLQPGQSHTCVVLPYEVTQADLERGYIDDTAAVNGTDNRGQAVDATDSARVFTVQPSPEIEMVKSVAPDTVDAAGQSVTYTYRVTNTGPTELHDVAIDELGFGGSGGPLEITCGETTLEPGAFTDCTATYEVTQADIDAGVIDNTAVARAVDAVGQNADTGPSSARVGVQRNPGLEFAKSVAPETVQNAGEPVEYTFTVTNSGNTSVHYVDVDDTDFSGHGALGALECPAGEDRSLAPGETLTCTAAYTVTQADIDAGGVDNTAHATGIAPDGGQVLSGDGQARVTAAQDTRLSMVKQAHPNDPGNFRVGQDVTYTFAVSNDGNTSVRDIGISETEFTGHGAPPEITCPGSPNPLPPGETLVCDALYTLVQADIDQGSVANTAHATGSGVESNESSVTLAGEPGSLLELEKSAEPMAVDTVGGTVTYTFTATNSGETTLTGLGIIENSFTGTGGPLDITCPTTTLAPGASTDCTATYDVTQADLDAGSITNTATARATTPSGDPTLSDSSTVTVDTTAEASLSLDKSVVPDTVAGAGDTVDYHFTVRNTGGVTLHDVTVADSVFSGTGTPPAATCEAGPVPPGEAVQCSASYAVTQADVDAGTITNIAYATARRPDTGASVASNDSGASVRVLRSSLRLEKSVDPDAAAAGTSVTYSYLVTNTGETALSGLQVADTDFSGTGTPPVVSCPADSLDVDASVTCSATYTVTTADAQAGQVTNAAVATAHNTSGTQVSSNQSDAVLTTHAPAELRLEKSVTPGSVDAAGQSVTYTFAVTNAGGTAVHDLEIIEDSFTGSGGPLNVSCDSTTLEPGVSTECTATYEVTQADIDAGGVDNTATARATDPVGETAISGPASARVDAGRTPGLTFAKSVEPETVQQAGEQVVYTFTASNTGNTTMRNVNVNDTGFTGHGTLGPLECPAGQDRTLAPGEDLTCTAVYTVTQADIDAGGVDNTADATGNDPDGTQVRTEEAGARVTAAQDARISLVKEASPDDSASFTLGREITYTYTVRNDGNTSVSGIGIVETEFTGHGTPPEVSCPTSPDPLPPGAVLTCTAGYTLVQADIDQGSVGNTAHATGAGVESNESAVTLTGAPGSLLELEKSAEPMAVDTVGGTVTYTFTATNSGETTLTGLGIIENSFTGTGGPLAVSCTETTLAPGASTDCTATYDVTQADLDAGSITNTATARATTPSGDPTLSDSSTVTVDTTAEASLSLTKSVVPDTVVGAGDTVTYHFTVRNTGGATLNNVTVTDSVFSGTGTPPAASCPNGPLPPGGERECTATYAVTQADVDAGTITNIAYATASRPDTGAQVTSNDTDASVRVLRSSLRLEKSVAPESAPVGDSVTYTYEVTNTGETALSALQVVDTAFSGSGTPPVVSCSVGSLDVNQSVTCSATYTVTTADSQAGQVTNTAVATAYNTSGTQVTSNESNAVLTTHAPAELRLTKSVAPDTVDAAGQSVTYTFRVTNDGGTAVQGLEIIEDSFSGSGDPPDVSCTETTLAPGASTECSATYEVTQADIDAGGVDNTATARATDPVGETAISEPASARVDAGREPGLTFAKSVEPETVQQAGEQVVYTFTASNTGNTTMRNVNVNDTGFTGHGTLGPLECPAGQDRTLAPGEDLTCTASYTVVQADIDQGGVDNTAHGSGIDPDGDQVRTEDGSARVTAEQDARISLVKAASPDDSASFTLGQEITYTYAVHNDGNTSVSGIAVAETEFTGHGTPPDIMCPGSPNPLPPGQTLTCTAVYTLVQADIDQGSVANTAHATGAGGVESNESSVTLTGEPGSLLELEKTADPVSVDTVGDTVTYTFTARNAGETTLTGLSVIENSFTGTGGPLAVSCTETTLAPGASTDCTATYEVTQADLDAGSITNTATARATTPSGDPTLSGSSTVTVDTTAPASLSLEKSAVPESVVGTGDVITYHFTVRNTGRTTLDNVTVTDSAFSGTGVPPTATCLNGPLPPGASTDCTATYVVTQADIDAGTITNLAHATANRPDTGAAVTSNDASASVGVLQSSLRLEKTVAPESAPAGESVTYTYLVTNTGETALSGLQVVDTAFSGSGTRPVVLCPVDSLDVGASVPCQATYTVTAADAQTGQVTNTAVASAHNTSGTQVSSNQSDAVLAVHAPAELRLAKSVTPESVDAAGQEVTYTFRVTNDGGTTVHGLTIVEDSFTGTGDPLDVSCAATTVAPGASTDCTATYEVTQADIDAGGIDNTATARATDTAGQTVMSGPASAHVDAGRSAGLDFVKSVEPETVHDAGEPVVYTFTITNRGNTSVYNVDVDGTAFTGGGELGALECPAGEDRTLAPGEALVCTVAYTVVQSDIDRGGIDNTAHATGSLPGGEQVRSADDRARVTAVQEPRLSLVKQAAPDDSASFTLGREITYTYTVRNDGNTSVSGIAVAETEFTGHGTPPDISCPESPDPLPPGETLTCTAVYTLVQADIDQGSVANTAQATGAGVESNEASVTLTGEPGSLLELEKSAEPTAVDTVGGTVTYTFTARNAGETTLTGLGIIENSFTGTGGPLAVSCDATTLAPGGSTDCSATYEVTQADLDAGSITNTATARATTPSGDTTLSGSSTVDVDTTAPASLTLAKSADPDTVIGAGDTVTYHFTVHNTGRTTLHDIAVADTEFSGTGTAPTATCPDGPLPPGASADCSATYEVTQADIDAGTITNTARATAARPDTGASVTSDDAGASVRVLRSALELEKTVDPDTAGSGATVTYTYKVTNSGETALSALQVADTAFSGTGTPPDVTCPVDSLDAGEVVTCTATYTVTAADAQAGEVTNTAVATARNASGTAVTSPEATAALTTQRPGNDGLELAKTGTYQKPKAAHRNGVIRWKFTVANTGDTVISDIRVDDPTAGEVRCPRTSLGPGESMTCEAGPYTVTDADIKLGHVKNTAVATGRNPGGEEVVSPDATTAVEIPVKPCDKEHPCKEQRSGAATRIRRKRVPAGV